jgi:HEAT repeat protein
VNAGCEANDAKLSLLVDGELGEPESSRLRQHLLGCERCQRERLALEELKALAGRLPLEQAPARLWRRIEAQLDASAAPRSSRARSRPVLLALAAGIALLLASREVLRESVRAPQPERNGAQRLRSREGEAGVARLAQLLRDPNADVRASAAESLGLAGREATAAIPALVAALQDENAEVRALAAQALGNLGSQAKTAAEPLRKLLEDPDAGVRAAAQAALEKIE